MLRILMTPAVIFWAFLSVNAEVSGQRRDLTQVQRAAVGRPPVAKIKRHPFLEKLEKLMPPRLPGRQVVKVNKSNSRFNLDRPAVRQAPKQTQRQARAAQKRALAQRRRAEAKHRAEHKRYWNRIYRAASTAAIFIRK